MSPDQLGEGRPDIRGPLGNLYFVGHWTRPGGGVTPVIVSAMRVAEAIAPGASTVSSVVLGEAKDLDRPA
jgi:phytoene dehydrogenase-like protein